MPRPKNDKKSEHVPRCALLDGERLAFSELVDFLVDLVPFQLWVGSTKNYLRIGIVQPEGDFRLSPPCIRIRHCCASLSGRCSR